MPALGGAPARPPVPPQGAPGGSGRPSTPREEAGPLGAQPRPRALEPAATEAARYPGFDRVLPACCSATYSPAYSTTQASQEGAAPRDLRRGEAAQDARAPPPRANPNLNPEPNPSPNPNKARYYRELALSRTLPLALARCATTDGSVSARCATSATTGAAWPTGPCGAGWARSRVHTRRPQAAPVVPCARDAVCP